jgi:anti-sigma factor RsiW
MECRDCSDDLTAYIDGELAGPAAEQVRRHLEKCPPCDDDYRGFKDAAVFMERQARELEPSPEIWNQLRARISEMPAPANSSGYFGFLAVNRWAGAAVTLAATVVLALGLWGYRQYQESQAQIESYVNEYIVTRSVAERIHAVQLRQVRKVHAGSDSAIPKVLENPFTEIRPVSLTNPFQTEER